MAEMSIDRDAYQKLKAGDAKALGGDDKMATFLANKFEEGEEQAKAECDSGEWIYNFWTYRF